MKDDNDLSSIDIDFGEPCMSYKEENTTQLQDTIKGNCMEDGYYVETDEHLKLEEIALDMPKSMKAGLSIELLDDELALELFECLSQLRAGKDSQNLSTEVKNILGRLIMQSTKNLQEEIEAIVSGGL